MKTNHLSAATVKTLIALFPSVDSVKAYGLESVHECGAIFQDYGALLPNVSERDNAIFHHRIYQAQCRILEELRNLRTWLTMLEDDSHPQMKEATAKQVLAMETSLWFLNHITVNFMTDGKLQTSAKKDPFTRIRALMEEQRKDIECLRDSLGIPQQKPISQEYLDQLAEDASRTIRAQTDEHMRAFDAQFSPLSPTEENFFSLFTAVENRANQLKHWFSRVINGK